MRLWIDTNQAWSVTRLRHLCRLARSKGVEVVIHSQTYLERRRQMRAETGEQFSEQRFDGFLRQQGIGIFEMTLDRLTAAGFADTLHGRYPSDERWELAKKQTLGGELAVDFQVKPGKMPMTVDWLIALAVEADPESRIITHDDGEEWRFLRDAEPRRALKWDEAMHWLQHFPA